MTVAEMEQRMSHREFIEQMVYDKILHEARQELAMDEQLRRDHAALVKKVGR